MDENEGPGRRRHPRRKVFSHCWVLWSTEHMSYRVPGLTVDASQGGLSVLIRHPSQVVWQEAMIRIPKDLELQAQPVHQRPWTSRVVGSQVGFEIKRFVSGEDQWAALCNGADGSQGVG